MRLLAIHISGLQESCVWILSILNTLRQVARVSDVRRGQSKLYVDLNYIEDVAIEEIIFCLYSFTICMYVCLYIHKFKVYARD